MDHLQRMLETVTDNTPDAAKRRWKLLSMYGELQFRRDGGGHCGLCNVHVRYKLPAVVKREGHSDAEYVCLCTRCIVSERAQGRAVHIRAGEMTYVFPAARPEEAAFDEIEDVNH